MKAKAAPAVHSSASLNMETDLSLQEIHKSLLKKWATIERKEARSELLKTVFKTHTKHILADSLFNAKLTNRIESLFEAIREKPENSWPAGEATQVIEGLVARLLAKRMVLLIVALLAVVPAISSMILLAQQNRHMIEQNRAEETANYDLIRTSLLDIIYNTYNQSVEEDGQFVQKTLPLHHRRIRAEAFGTFISLEKQRWTNDELTSLPPKRWVDLRSADLRELALGGRIGLVRGESRNDFTRIFLENANLEGITLMQARLTGSIFRNANASNFTLSSPDATYADFSGIDATNSIFDYDGKSSTPLDLSHSNFDNANLTNASFRQAIFNEVSFENARLSGAILDSCYVINCDWTSVDLGVGVDLSTSPIHKTLVRSEQLTLMKLLPFCTPEDTEDPEIVRLVTDYQAYEVWQAEQMEILEKAAEEEIKQLQGE